MLEELKKTVCEANLLLPKKRIHSLRFSYMLIIREINECFVARRQIKQHAIKSFIYKYTMRFVLLELEMKSVVLHRRNCKHRIAAKNAINKCFQLQSFAFSVFHHTAYIALCSKNFSSKKQT